jgi:hypothetical protein
MGELIERNKTWTDNLCVVLQTQEREAKENMKRKAKELQRQRQDAVKYGRNASGYTGISGGSGRPDSQMVESVSVDTPKPSSYNPAPRFRIYLIELYCQLWKFIIIFGLI